MTRKQSRELIARLNRDGERIARHFGLVYRSIEAERANVKRRYGICYDDGTIRIRLRHVVSGKPLKYSSLVNTLCHELAHLEHFDHSPRFHDFYRKLLAWARAEGIYRPRRPMPAAAAPAPAPVTLGPLFAAHETRGIPRPQRPARRSPAASQGGSGASAAGSSGKQLSLFG